MSTLTQAIDFNQISNTIPDLKNTFKPGPPTNIGAIISLLLPYLFVIAGLLLFIYLLYGGLHMMIAANDEKGLSEAKKKITYALIGFLLLFTSFWLVKILGYILGVNLI